MSAWKNTLAWLERGWGVGLKQKHFHCAVQSGSAEDLRLRSSTGFVVRSRLRFMGPRVPDSHGNKSKLLLIAYVNYYTRFSRISFRQSGRTTVTDRH